MSVTDTDKKNTPARICIKATSTISTDIGFFIFLVY